MARTYVTTATTTQCSGPCRKALIQINTALTGTITVVDNTTGATPVIAVITNPTVGQRYEYFNFDTGVRIITSATCDITVNTDGSYGANN